MLGIIATTTAKKKKKLKQLSSFESIHRSLCGAIAASWALSAQSSTSSHKSGDSTLNRCNTQEMPKSKLKPKSKQINYDSSAARAGGSLGSRSWVRLSECVDVFGLALNWGRAGCGVNSRWCASLFLLLLLLLPLLSFFFDFSRRVFDIWFWVCLKKFSSFQFELAEFS